MSDKMLKKFDQAMADLNDSVEDNLTWVIFGTKEEGFCGSMTIEVLFNETRKLPLTSSENGENIMFGEEPEHCVDVNSVEMWAYLFSNELRKNKG